MAQVTAINESGGAASAERKTAGAKELSGHVSTVDALQLLDGATST